MKVKGAPGSVKEVATLQPVKKLGRPFNPKSEGYRRRKALEERKKQNEGYIPLGRPVVLNSKHHKMLVEIQHKRENGEIVKPGRPKMTEIQKAASRKYHAYMRQLLGLNVVKKAVVK